MKIALSTFLVQDYDEAIAWFTQTLGFRLVENRTLSPDKRWVVVAAESGTPLLLAKATTPSQIGAIGAQAGGRVAFFLETDSFERDYARMAAAGVRFREAPRHEEYGTVAVFEDLYGQPWDLIERVS